ncbi:MAG: sulfurtransferase TusA family protein [Parvularculaceae bacterium]
MRQSEQSRRSAVAPTINPPVLDARGWRCPMPVIRMEAALRRLPPGARLKVLVDDPVATVDIPHFCSKGGHRIERLPDEAGACVFLVTRAE